MFALRDKNTKELVQMEVDPMADFQLGFGELVNGTWNSPDRADAEAIINGTSTSMQGTFFNPFFPSDISRDSLEVVELSVKD